MLEVEGGGAHAPVPHSWRRQCIHDIKNQHNYTASVFQFVRAELDYTGKHSDLWLAGQTGRAETKKKKQEIWANAHETRDSISLILYAGFLGLSPVI